MRSINGVGNGSSAPLFEQRADPDFAAVVAALRRLQRTQALAIRVRQKEETFQALARVRPAAAGANEILGVRSWGRDPWTMGAFAEIAPGRCASTAEWTARPHGRIHFAGEHTGFDHPGVEAALASGVRAVVEISDSITRPGT